MESGRGRREIVADAGVAVLADAGMRGLTHRAVDARAGLPAGAASNVFRTRRDLIAGIVDRLVNLDGADLAAMPRTGAGIAELMGTWRASDSQRFSARAELALEARRDEAVAARMAAGRAAIVAVIDEARRAAVEDPFAETGLTSAQIVALFSGLQWAELTTGEPVVDALLTAIGLSPSE